MGLPGAVALTDPAPGVKLSGTYRCSMLTECVTAPGRISTTDWMAAIAGHSILDVRVMFLVEFARHQKADNQIYGFAVGGIEVDRFGEPDHRGTTLLESFDPAMRESHAHAQTRASETFAFDELLEDGVGRYLRRRPDEKLAQDFEAVLLASCMRIA